MTYNDHWYFFAAFHFRSVRSVSPSLYEEFIPEKGRGAANLREDGMSPTRNTDRLTDSDEEETKRLIFVVFLIRKQRLFRGITPVVLTWWLFLEGKCDGQRRRHRPERRLMRYWGILWMKEEVTYSQFFSFFFYTIAKGMPFIARLVV